MFQSHTNTSFLALSLITETLSSGAEESSALTSSNCNICRFCLRGLAIKDLLSDNLGAIYIRALSHLKKKYDNSKYSVSFVFLLCLTLRATFLIHIDMLQCMHNSKQLQLKEYWRA